MSVSVRYGWVIVALAMISSLMGGCRGVEVSRYYPQGALATSAPIATTVGEKIFEKGGNAFDVAVAVGFALAVVHPEAGNIGGGGFALVRDGKSGIIQALDFRETAPHRATETMYLDAKGEVIPKRSTFGALACGVPGTVAGLHELWRRFGSLSWEELVTPAALLADTGFIVDEYLAQSLEEHGDDLRAFEETADIFFPDGKKLQAGDRFVQKELAKTLYAIAASCVEGFYSGPVAEKIVAAMEKHGGLIDRSDLENYKPLWRMPIRFSFDSFEVYSMPPPSSGGIAVGQILKIVEPYDFSTFTPDSPEYIRLFCEASKLAFADRSAHLGDPEFYQVPSGLLDSAYLARRRSILKEKEVTPANLITPGSPAPEESPQTTHFSVADADGNIVSLTYTLNTAYGCKLVVAGAGFLLNNEMDDFSIKPGYPNTYGLIGGEANKIEPGKRMLSSMSPTIVLKDNKPYLVLGAPGGSRIITTVAEAIIDFTRFDMSLKQMVAQPRFHHQWLPDKIFMERDGFPQRVIERLVEYGYEVEECDPYSDLQAVYIKGAALMTSASDPRKRGTAGGF